MLLVEVVVVVVVVVVKAVVKAVVIGVVVMLPQLSVISSSLKKLLNE